MSVGHIHAASLPFKWPYCHPHRACSHLQGIIRRPCFAKDFRLHSGCADQSPARKTLRWLWATLPGVSSSRWSTGLSTWKYISVNTRLLQLQVFEYFSTCEYSGKSTGSPRLSLGPAAPPEVVFRAQNHKKTRPLLRLRWCSGHRITRKRARNSALGRA